MSASEAGFREAFAGRLARLIHLAGWLGAGRQEWLAHIEPWTELAWLVVTHNRTAGLTRITAPEEMAAKHFLDSLSPLACDVWRSGADVVDVGSGAGFPGLALAVALPMVSMTMIEASSRKAAFLRLASAHLGVRARVVHSRAEDYGGDRAGKGRESHDIGLARAAAPFPVSCELVVPLLRVGGSYVAQLGPADGELLEELAGQGDPAQAPWGVLGAVLDDIRRVDLPDGEGRRFVARFEKCKPTPRRYPRRAGVPARNPLPGFER